MSTINVEWLNQNSQRNYPFRENMLLRPSMDGELMDAYRLPNGCILDMVVATNFDPQPEVYLSAFTLAGNVATAVLSNAANDEVLAIASVSQGDEDQTPVNFIGYGTHDDIRGTVVFGDLKLVGEFLPDGIYRFPSSESLFETRCVRPSIPCVSGLYIKGPLTTDEAPRLRGDVALIAGNNVHLEYDLDNNAIIINADNNYAYNDKCDCATGDNRVEVRSINGVSMENVVIEGDDCVHVETSNGRIRITDKCSKPCCGCSELTFLNQKTNEITTALGRLDSFSQELSARVDQLAARKGLKSLSISEVYKKKR